MTHRSNSTPAPAGSGTEPWGDAARPRLTPADAFKEYRDYIERVAGDAHKVDLRHERAMLCGDHGLQVTHNYRCPSCGSEMVIAR